ncbi:unnamed protein product, partial [marine sediment metagenome]
SVAYTVYCATVPDGEIWVVRHISIKNMTSMCDLWLNVFSA